jgi:hypothetical protein
MPLPGERAALEALVWNWGAAYEIGVDDGEWWCRRRDGIGGRESASTAEDLRAWIVTDYTIFPVPREYHTITSDSTPAYQHRSADPMPAHPTGPTP